MVVRVAAAFGAHGLAPEELDRVVAETAPALDKLRRRHADGSLPLLGLLA